MVPTPSATDLLIPFAGHDGPACRAALGELRLPNLEALAARLPATDVDEQPDDTRSPPHERALARALGLDAPDGCLPWAALEARRSGLAPAGDTQAWGWITLCHWQVGMNDVALGDPAQVRVDASESAALLAAARPFFEEDGIALHPGAAPGHWLAQGAVFQGLPTASLDRAVGQPIAQWLPPSDDGARSLRKLQNEMQMLLYTQRVNDERVARGLLPINSFWLSGTGALTSDASAGASADVAGPTVIDTLRAAAQADDGAAWADAWRALDAGPLATLLAAQRRGEPVSLTLCGTRVARTFAGRKSGLGRLFQSLFGRQPISSVLLSL